MSTRGQEASCIGTYLCNEQPRTNLRDRLNLQHFLWKMAIGYLVHPSIRSSLKETAATSGGGDRVVKVADVCTGTAFVLPTHVPGPHMALTAGEGG